MKKSILLLLIIFSAFLYAETNKIYQPNSTVENAVSAQSKALPKQDAGKILSAKNSSLVSWTSKPILDNPMNFHFAIVSDRTGGHRSNIFRNAMHQINLMQPEFTICVGDLIEGATTNISVLNKEFTEMDSILNTLNMKFYRIPGNHDIGNKTMLNVYKKHYGSPYYHFIYKNVLFLIISTEDPPVSTISDAQVEFVKKTLQNNKNVRWTCVFMHEPLFMKAYDGKNENWLKIEKLLENRQYNLFAGHYHGYQKFVRNGKKFIRLATTGGASNLSGIKNGAFDQIMWVTMTDQGPVIANIALNGLLDEDLK